MTSRDIRAAITGGRLTALTAVIGSGKTILSRRLRGDFEHEGRVIVSRSLSVDKAKITVPLLLATLFYDLTPEKTVSISSQSERRQRDLQELFRRARNSLIARRGVYHCAPPRVADRHAADSQGGLDVEQAEAEAVVQPDRVLNHLGRKAEAAVRIRGRRHAWHGAMAPPDLPT